jgi:hypothetical protein
VSAAEIASWEYCPEAWRLDASGADPGNPSERTRGDAFHSRTAFVEVWSRRILWCGLALVLLAAVIGTLWFLFGRGAE